jgi:hypothetical protein
MTPEVVEFPILYPLSFILRFTQGFKEIVAGLEKAESELASTARIMVDAFAEQQQFDAKKKRIEEKIRVGHDYNRV